MPWHPHIPIGGGGCARRSPARVKARRQDNPATMKRRSWPKPRRNNFPRRDTAKAAPACCLRAGPRGRPERFRRPRQVCRASCGI